MDVTELGITNLPSLSGGHPYSPSRRGMAEATAEQPGNELDSSSNLGSYQACPSTILFLIGRRKTCAQGVGGRGNRIKYNRCDERRKDEGGTGQRLSCICYTSLEFFTATMFGERDHTQRESRVHKMGFFCSILVGTGRYKSEMRRESGG